jgi:Domain of unknown function (DUF4328)
MSASPSSGGSDPALSAGGAESLRPLGRRARWAIVALAALIVCEGVVILMSYLEVGLLERVLSGETVPVSELEASDSRTGLVGGLEFVAFVAAGVFFIRWFHAAYANLAALGQSNLRFRPGWAIGSWFVPILNLWRPKQIANDIWTGSAPFAPSYPESGWKEVPVPQLLGFWWAAWLGCSVVGNIAARTWFDTSTAQDLQNADKLEIAASVLTVVAALLAIAVIRSLSSRQDRRAEQLAGLAEVGAPARASLVGSG